MALRKRTQRLQPDAPDLAPEASPSAGRSLTLRDEKIIVMLAVQVQQINDRLTRLEDRFETSLRDSMSQPDQQDLLELRLHSARLAAELSRVAMELRSEINDLAQSRGEVIDLTVIDDIDLGDPEGTVHPSAGPLPHRRIDDLVADLRDATTPRPRPRRTSGWKPVRSTAPRDDTDA